MGVFLNSYTLKNLYIAKMLMNLDPKKFGQVVGQTVS